MANPKWFNENVPDEIADSEIFQFNIAVNDQQVIKVDMKSDIGVEYHNIQSQLEDVPSTMVYWAAMYSELKEQVTILDRKIRARRGKLTAALLKKFQDDKIRLTDKQLQCLVDGDSKINELEEELSLMQKNTGKMYYMIEAIRMKAEVLRSLSGFARFELEHSK